MSLCKCKTKNKLPISKVFKGVNEFKVELIELFICVWAKANRNMGKNCLKTCKKIGTIFFFRYVF